MALFETIFLVYARKTIWGIFFTYSMTLLNRTWYEKSNGVGFRAIQHTQCARGQCENRLRTFCSPVYIWSTMQSGIRDIWYKYKASNMIGLIFTVCDRFASGLRAPSIQKLN
jgi:hypothetical protein